MAATQENSPNKILPEFHLLFMDRRFAQAFDEAVESHFPELREHTPNITVHDCALQFVPQEVRFDAMVSPANSYGRLDGAFDDALARAYAPTPTGSAYAPTRDGYGWITHKAQRVLYDTWKGFVPPGTCTIVPLDHDTPATGSAPRTNPWGTEFLLLCPTMAIPKDVRWDREVVYECIWSMLCVVDKHNREQRAATGEGARGKEIKSIMMTPLATGVGRVSAKRWAIQCVLAMKFFVEASRNPETWSNLGWGKILTDHEAINATIAD